MTSSSPRLSYSLKSGTSNYRKPITVGGYAREALSQVNDAGYQNVEVYIEALNVSLNDLKANENAMMAIEQVLRSGTVTKVVVFTEGGVVEWAVK